MLTPRQAAARLNVSLSLIYQLCKEMTLRHFRIGGIGKRGRIRIEVDEVERFRLACRREEGPPELPQLRHLKLDGYT